MMIATLIAGLVAIAVIGFVFMRHKPIVLAIFIGVAALPLLFGSTSGALITTVIVFSVVTAQPLFVVLGLITLACFHFMAAQPPADYGIFPEKIFGLTDKHVLLAIPFFVVSGAIMTSGGIAKRLIELAKDLTRWLPGGLAIAAIGGCVLFAAISGSSPVTVIAIGGMMYPALVKAGFGERNSIGLLTSAGSLGIVIPPSIPMIIYAIVVSGHQVIDVGDLFLAGVGPGFLIGTLLAAYVIWQALKISPTRSEDIRKIFRGFGIIAIPLVIGQVVVMAGFIWGYLLGPILLSIMAVVYARKAFVEGFWALMLPVLILGGIYSGLFTPTEAAAVAVVYSLVAAIYIYKELEWKQLPPLVTESTIMMGALIVIMVIAFVFNDYLVDEEIPQRAVDWMKSMNLSRVEFLLALNVFLLIVGCFMDIISAILIVAPLIVPMAMAPGIDVDPIHLGIIFIVNLELGYLTPPLGLNLFVSSTLFKKPIGEVVRAVIPYTGLMLIGILVVTYVPMLSLGPGLLLTEIYSTGEPKIEKNIMSLKELMKQSEAAEEDDDDDWDDEDDGEETPPTEGTAPTETPPAEGAAPTDTAPPAEGATPTEVPPTGEGAAPAPAEGETAQPADSPPADAAPKESP